MWCYAVSCTQRWKLFPSFWLSVVGHPSRHLEETMVQPYHLPPNQKFPICPWGQEGGGRKPHSARLVPKKAGKTQIQLGRKFSAKVLKQSSKKPSKMPGLAFDYLPPFKNFSALHRKSSAHHRAGPALFSLHPGQSTVGWELLNGKKVLADWASLRISCSPPLGWITIWKFTGGPSTTRTLFDWKSPENGVFLQLFWKAPSLSASKCSC